IARDRQSDGDSSRFNCVVAAARTRRRSAARTESTGASYGTQATGGNVFADAEASGWSVALNLTRIMATHDLPISPLMFSAIKSGAWTEVVAPRGGEDFQIGSIICFREVDASSRYTDAP